MQLSPYSVQAGGGGGADARLSIKFAADKDWGYNSINNVWGAMGAGVLGSTNWFNFAGPNGGSQGVTNVPFFTQSGLTKYASRTVLVYNWANEINAINSNIPLDNNVALMDGFINVNNNTWYLSVTNLDAPFTNGYTVYFYYRGNNVGWGGQNYLKYYAGPTTNSAVLGTQQWNLYTTVTANDGHFTRDLTPYNTGTAGETPGANFITFANARGGAFDLLITNGNYGGVSALEIVANPSPTASSLNIQPTNGSVILTWTQGLLLQATNVLGPWTTNNGTSPQTNLAAFPQMFFRVQAQ